MVFLILHMLKLRKSGQEVEGRTIREFQSDRDVWCILDSWASGSKYELLDRDASSRTYRKKKTNSTMFQAPTVQIGWSGKGYWIAAWLDTTVLCRMFPHGWVWPQESAIDKKGMLNWMGDSYRLDPRNVARNDINALIEKLDAGIEPIP